MSDNTTDFFDGIGTGAGAPSAVLKNVGDFVHGQIVEMFKRDYIPFGKTEPEKRDDGSNKQQLVVILQTEDRNWANVSKVPKVDFNDPNSADKDPSEDDGKRAVYVPEGKNIQFAIGRAVGTAKQANPNTVFEVGGSLGVKITNLKPTDKGNPLKEHEAIYKPKADDFFQGTQAPQSAPPAEQAPAQSQPPAQSAPPQNQAQQAPPQQDPWATSGQAAQQDPWATQSAPSGKQPPF